MEQVKALVLRAAGVNCDVETEYAMQCAGAEAQRVQEANVERTVSLSAKGTRPAFVAGDPSLLARAIGNLLDNAARHSIAGGDIRVPLESAPHEVRIVVEDDGPGIPVERHDLIFQRFFRGPDVGRRGIAGCGLGLPSL